MLVKADNIYTFVYRAYQLYRVTENGLYFFVGTFQNTKYGKHSVYECAVGIL